MNCIRCGVEESPEAGSTCHGKKYEDVYDLHEFARPIKGLGVHLRDAIYHLQLADESVHDQDRRFHIGAAVESLTKDALRQGYTDFLDQWEAAVKVGCDG